MSFPLHYLELSITDTAVKVSRSLHCFTTSVSHGAENFLPISDAIFEFDVKYDIAKLYLILMKYRIKLKYVMYTRF